MKYKLMTGVYCLIASIIAIAILAACDMKPGVFLYFILWGVICAIRKKD